MPIASTANVIDVLQQGQILPPAQLTEVRNDLQRRWGTPQALLQELVRRGWLTVFQAQQISQGRGSDLIRGRYLLLEPLGKGGASHVFKARHQKMNRLVALKILKPELLKDSEATRRFCREIEVASQLSHPNLVHALEAGPIGPLLVLVMEYVDGPDLEQLVQKSGPLPVGQACETIRQAAVGLQYAHERGLVHRDIKPGNLLVTGASAHGSQPVGLGGVKILDLGLARVQKPGANDKLTMLAGAGVMQGTPDYMAPEQALDFHSADIRSDIYSLGCTFYFLLTGQPPFPAGSLAEKLIKHAQAEPPISAIAAALPPGVVLVLRKMLAKRSPERYQTPAEVAAALAPFCSAFGPATSGSRPGSGAAAGRATRASSSGAAATKPLIVNRLARSRPKRRTWLLAVVALVLLLWGVAAAVTSFWKPAETVVQVPTTATRSAPARATQPPPKTEATVVLRTGPIKICSYQDEFKGPTPAPGWQYLWNPKGALGSSVNYAPLRWNDRGYYDVTGVADPPAPEPAGNLRLARDGSGNPGRGSAQSAGKSDHFAIAAYTIKASDGTGSYRVTNSSIAGGNALQVVVLTSTYSHIYVRNVPPPAATPLAFDTHLGDLRAGDIVYVAVGPAGNDTNDAFRDFNFSLTRSSTPEAARKTVVLRDAFESLDKAWEKGGEATVALDTDRPHQGKTSCRITLPGGAVPNPQVLRRIVDDNVAAGDLYRVTLWVRSSEVDADPGAFAALEFIDDKIIHSLAFSKMSRFNGANGWEQLTFEGSVPREARRVRLNLVLRAHGSAWFDDIEVTRESSNPTVP